MNAARLPKISLLFTALCLAPLAHAAGMTTANHDAEKARISADYKSADKACGSLAANAKDVCVEEARAKQKVARAELEFAFSGKAADQSKVLVAKAESAYAVAKERCDDQSGQPKTMCVSEAKAIETKALADVKLAQKVGDARQDAAETRTDADYKVAADKCDVLSGDAKSSCTSAAKTKYGKH